jgi:hypothetical protein
MSQSQAVDTGITACRMVRYGIYHPEKGWLAGGKYHQWSNQPYLYQRESVAKSWARSKRAQLVVFDVIPCLRSWPSEEDKERNL